MVPCPSSVRRTYSAELLTLAVCQCKVIADIECYATCGGRSEFRTLDPLQDLRLLAMVDMMNRHPVETRHS